MKFICISAAAKRQRSEFLTLDISREALIEPPGQILNGPKILKQQSPRPPLTEQNLYLVVYALY